MDPNRFMAFTESLRDILLILSTVSLIALSGFMAAVGWQLYRLGRALYREMLPILASLRNSADSVKAVTAFVNHQMVSPARGAISLGLTARGFYQAGADLLRSVRAERGSGDAARQGAGPSTLGDR